MDPRTARKLLSRMGDLDRKTPQVRLGVITDIDPLSVALGGSDTAYTDVKALGGQIPSVDDVVAALTFGADLLILGTIGKGIPTVTSLPTDPVDGQEIYYLADAANGVVWHLRYRAGSSSSYKWEFIGGSELATAVADGTDVTPGGVYVASTGLTDLTIPLAGDWDITIRHDSFCANGGQYAYASYAVGGTAANGADAAYAYLQTGFTDQVTVSKTQRKTISAAATALSPRFNCAAGVFKVRQVQLRARPVRVG